ncbi:MAG: dihydroorotate dehydrogenase electron transfer subunit [Thermoplasmata archaeon]
MDSQNWRRLWDLHVEILDVIDENPSVKTFLFNFNMAVKPGQFCMVWDGRGEEVPMSFSYIDKPHGITVKKVGKSTAFLHKLRRGEILRVRGPFGNGYSILPQNYLIVSGGTGIASVASAAETIAKIGGKCVFLAGFRTADDVFFIERLRKGGITLKICTDDGSLGYKGFVTALAKKIIEKEKFDLCIACGPEPMLKELCKITAGKIKTFVSLERHIKCGIGICDACSIYGLRVCMEGPVFDADVLLSKGFGGD